jgi:hypothetical protein
MPVTFSAGSTSTYPSPASGGRLLFIDADGDGDEDILYQTGANGTAWAYARADGGGSYTLLALSASPFAGLTIPDDVTGSSFHVLDYDGDGDLDIWGASPNFSTGSLFRNNGNGTFSDVGSGGMPTAGAGSRVITGDFDNDGDDDILYQTNANGSAFQYGRSNGDGTFTILAQSASPFAGLTLTDNTGYAHHVGDFDGDGDDDVWMAVNSTTGTFLRNDGGGVFTQQSSATFPAPGAGSRVVVGDFDSDGDDDILYQTVGNGTAFQYARSNGDGTFTILSQAASPFAGLSLPDMYGTSSNFVAADVDGDGDLDLMAGVNGAQGSVFIASGAPPRLAASAPSDNGTGVAVGANLTLTFNESVTKGAGNIYIYRGDGALIETISVNSAQVTGSGTTWTIDPSVTLAGSTNYYVRTDRGIFRDADNSIFFGITNSTTLNFTTAAVNTAPTFTNLNSDIAAHTENVPVRLDVGGNATVADAESANFDTGTLTVSITANGQSGQDVLSVANVGNGAGQIGVSGSAILYQGVQIGTFTGGTGGANLVITFDADATPTAVQALVRALQYNNTSDAPNTATRTVTLVLTDGDGGTSATQTTSVTVTAANDIHTGGASITGTEAENGVLTAVSTMSDPDGIGTLHYQWQRDTGGGYVNVGSDQATYTLGDSDVGGVIRVVIYYTDAGGTVESSVSGGTNVIAAVNDPHTGGVSITGTETEDQVLTADTSTLADVDGLGTVHYDWQRDTGSGFVSIGAADQSTYTLGDADVGASVRVVISYTDGQGFTESATSNSTGAITNVNDVHTGGASITGTEAEDGVLTAVSTLADADGIGTLHYQWQRNVGGGYVNVGTDQSTYTLGDADVGSLMRVIIYYTDAGGTVESATSGATGPIANVDDAAVARNDAVSTVESAPVSGDLFADNGSGADSDVDGPALTIAAVNGSAANVGTQITLASGALLTVNADGAYTYNPNGRFNDLPGAGSGSVNTATETFTYTLANGNTATVTVTVNGEASTTGDILVGGGGNDVQTGSNGSDRIVGGAGNDTIDGGAGIDTVTYSTAQTGVIVRLNHSDVPNDGFGGTDTITGVENVTGGAFNDILIGAGGANTLIGGGGYDVLIGLNGNDILIGGAGTANELYGGMGDDIYYIDANDTVIELAGQGNDTIFTTRNVFTMPDHVERLIFNGTGDFLAVGSEQNNIISGGIGNDQLYGRGGYDVLIGGAGNDILGGGSGLANELYGGQGDDTYLVDANDTIVELAGQGIDTIRTTIGSYNLGANVENLNYIGTGNFVGRGNELDNIITGRWGDDILTGGGGNDTLNGGDGRDTAVLSGVAGDYSFTYVTGSTWTVTDRVGGRDGVDTLINIERVAFSDGTFRILTPPPAALPALSDKEMDQAQVLPVLADDFLFGKGDGGAQVLPGLTDGGDPLVLPGQHAVMLESFLFETDASGQPITTLEDLHQVSGTPQHNDWLL